MTASFPTIDGGPACAAPRHSAPVEGDRSAGASEPAADAPTVSVVIPTFNSAPLVVEAVESVLAQTHRALEVLVIDDGSSDDTAARLARFPARVQCIRQPNGGPARARNHGTSRARGEWIALLDADDLWLPDKLARQFTRAAETNAEVVLTALHWPTPNGETIVGYAGSTARDVLLPKMLTRNVLAGGASSALLRREVFDRIGGFDADLVACEDRDFFLRVADQCRVAFVAAPLVRRRTGPVQFGGDPERNRAANEFILQRHAHRLAGLPGAARTLREARARIHQRAGLHYLGLGRRGQAWRDFIAAVRLWPFLADPWRAAINAVLGRLPR